MDRKNFGVTFNLCHTLAVGDEPRIPALLEQAGTSLLAVTINGADADVKGPQWNRLIQTLDRGSFDVGVVLRTLRKIGYDGPIGLQGYGLEGDRRDNLARSMAAWRKRNPPGLPPGPCRDASLPGPRKRPRPSGPDIAARAGSTTETSRVATARTRPGPSRSPGARDKVGAGESAWRRTIASDPCKAQFTLTERALLR